MIIFWLYVVTQLVSTAYGITVINSVRKVPALRKRLRESGYTQRDKNSLYKFNDWLKYFFKGFIPFYYAYKALQLTNSMDPVGVLMQEEIDNGNYISKEDEAVFKDEEQRAMNSLAYDPNAFMYEEVGPYKARKIELNEIYDDDETPLEYITREFEKDSSNKITPFTKDSTVVEEKPEEETKISNKELVEAISQLSGSELEELAKKLGSLAEIKKNNYDSYKEDVA